MSPDAPGEQHGCTLPRIRRLHQPELNSSDNCLSSQPIGRRTTMVSSKRLAQSLAANKTLLVFFALMVVFRSAVADWMYVPSGSMNPTIVEGDRILVDKAA